MSVVKEIVNCLDRDCIDHSEKLLMITAFSVAAFIIVQICYILNLLNNSIFIHTKTRKKSDLIFFAVSSEKSATLKYCLDVQLIENECVSRLSKRFSE